MQRPLKPYRSHTEIPDENIPDETSTNIHNATLYESISISNSKKTLDQLGEKGLSKSKSITEVRSPPKTVYKPPQNNIFKSGVIISKASQPISNGIPQNKPPKMPNFNTDNAMALHKPPLPNSKSSNGMNQFMPKPEKRGSTSILELEKPDFRMLMSVNQPKNKAEMLKSQTMFIKGCNMEESKEFKELSKNFEKQVSLPSKSNKLLNIKNEKFIEESMQEIKKKLDDNLKDFEKKLSHELSIISFLEDAFPTLESMRSNYKNELFDVFGFILSKYLYSRINYFKMGLERQENLLQIENWDMVRINALLSKKVENFVKRLGKYEENMKVFNEEIKNFQTKDSKIKNFMSKTPDLMEDKQRILKKSFLTLFMSISEYLEKGKKHGASKFCYVFILRMYYFLQIYKEVGFYEMDFENKIETKDFQENLMKMDLEGLKVEIIKVFKAIY